VVVGQCTSVRKWPLSWIRCVRVCVYAAVLQAFGARPGTCQTPRHRRHQSTWTPHHSSSSSSSRRRRRRHHWWTTRRLSSFSASPPTESGTNSTSARNQYAPAPLGLHTHTRTRAFSGPLSGTTRLSQYHKGKTNLDFTEARDSEWQWHQLGHM